RLQRRFQRVLAPQCRRRHTLAVAHRPDTDRCRHTGRKRRERFPAAYFYGAGTVKRSSVVLAATAALLLGAYGGLLWLTGADGTRFLLDRATAWTPGLTLVYDTGSLRKGLV